LDDALKIKKKKEKNADELAAWVGGWRETKSYFNFVCAHTQLSPLIAAALVATATVKLSHSHTNNFHDYYHRCVHRHHVTTHRL
jgi:hypothetical protein